MAARAESTSAAVSPRLRQLQNDISTLVRIYAASETGGNQTQSQTLAEDAILLISSGNYVKTALRQQAALKLRQKNALLPINRLPTDVRVAILQFAVNSSTTVLEAPAYYRRLKIVASVSFGWRQLVLHAPPFWTSISNQQSPALLDTALRRSISSPLHVTAKEKYDVSSTFYKKIGLHMGRWKSLTLESPTAEGLAQCLKKPLPLLESLRIDIKGEGATFEAIQRFAAGRAERLRSISLYNCPLNWGSKIFSNLQQLELICIPYSGPSYRQIVKLLKASPRLQVLKLEMINFDHTSESRDLKVVTMPFLKRLHLRGMPYTQLQDFLRKIEAPNCSWLDISELTIFTSGRASTQLFDESMAHWRPQMRCMLTNARRISVQVEGSDFNLITEPGSALPNTRLCLDIRISYFAHTMSWLTRGSPSPAWSCPVSLTYGSDWGMMSDIDNVAFGERCLQTFPTVTSFTLDMFSGIADVLQFLGTSKTERGAKRWPARYLTRLTVRMDDEPFQALLDMIRSRYGQDDQDEDSAVEDSETAPPVLPVKLKELTLKGQAAVSDYEDELVEITDIVGEENVRNEIEALDESEEGGWGYGFDSEDDEDDSEDDEDEE